MDYLMYKEGEKPWFRPRHPYVSIHDTVVAGVAFVLVFFTNAYLQLYFLVVAAMFAVSALHHWLAYASWHHRLDRSMIQVMIAGTPLPYTDLIVSNGDLLWLSLLWFSALSFVLIKSFFGYLTQQSFWSALAYVITGLLAVVVMCPIEIDSGWAIVFWSGVGLYALQLLSYNRKWFDFFPEQFGYREIQHIILLGAIILHAIASQL